MPRHPLSSLEAVVHWKQPTIFAGESIDCTITFKNTERAEGKGSANNGSVVSAEQRRGLDGSRKLTGPTAKGRFSGHRQTNSLNFRANPIGSALPQARNGSTGEEVPRGEKHGRSLSIISLGSDPGGQARGGGGDASSRRPASTHARSLSMQTAGQGFTTRSPSVGSSML